MKSTSAEAREGDSVATGASVSSCPAQLLLSCEGAAQQCEQRLRTGQQITEWQAARLLEAHAQQILAADVGVEHTELRIEQQQARGQGIEQFSASVSGRTAAGWPAQRP